MIPNTRIKSKQGICENCDKPAEVFNTRGNIEMCQVCIDEEKQFLEDKVLGNQVANQMRVIDTTSELKADIFNAQTVAITELKAAIWADENIPDNRKQYVYTQELARHFEILQKQIFDETAALLTKKNDMRAWQSAAQTAAGALTAVEREHFKKLNMSYEPTQVKTPKPGKSKSPAKNYKGSEFRDAAAKYNVDVAAVRMISIQRNVSADEAAKIFAEQIAKSKQAN